MCGIVGINSEKPFSIKDKLIKSLKRLEYRGYDSVGYAELNGNYDKDIGYVEKFRKTIDPELKTTLAISHTRWATHGGVTKINSHPHFNTDKTLFAIHNGIIENFQEIKKQLQKEGYKFITETDSEIIPHYFDNQLKQGNDIKTAINFMKEIHGTFAILLFKKDEQTIYALKRDSPLALGVCKDKMILGSDIYAFSNETNKAIFFDDNEFAIIKPTSYQFYNQEGKELQKQPTEFKWSSEEETKDDFPHYMIKEIKEQPEVAQRLLDSFTTTQKSKIEKFIELIKQHKKILFLACGTSYHASLIGSIVLNRLGYDARSIIASEVETFVTFNKDTLVIAISQSGETMDVIVPMKRAKAAGAKIVSIVNVPFSTIQRHSETSLEILAGQEICVASTKAFTNQVITLLEIARRLGYNINLTDVPRKIQQTIALNEGKVIKQAENINKHQNMFVLGRGLSYPMAREIALKFKEISYVHAEGMMGGELKHGTIALIEEGTPVISLIPNKDPEMRSNSKEVEARGAKIYAITNTDMNSGYEQFRVPESDNAEFAIYSCIIGHLLSYYIAVIRGNEIDRPRNLAKCVSVL